MSWRYATEFLSRFRKLHWKWTPLITAEQQIPISHLYMNGGAARYFHAILINEVPRIWLV